MKGTLYIPAYLPLLLTALVVSCSIEIGNPEQQSSIEVGSPSVEGTIVTRTGLTVYGAQLALVPPDFDLEGSTLLHGEHKLDKNHFIYVSPDSLKKTVFLDGTDYWGRFRFTIDTAVADTFNLIAILNDTLIPSIFAQVYLEYVHGTGDTLCSQDHPVYLEKMEYETIWI